MDVAARDVRSDRGRLFSSRAATELIAETKTANVAVVGIVFVAYVASLIAAIAVGHNASYFAFVGQKFLDRSETSEAIESNVDAAFAGAGYDGQFSLFIAQDPAGAHAYVDDPSYRSGRVEEPCPLEMLVHQVDLRLRSCPVVEERLPDAVEVARTEADLAQ